MNSPVTYSDPARDDLGGQDKVRSVYRATRFPASHIDQLLAAHPGGAGPSKPSPRIDR